MWKKQHLSTRNTAAFTPPHTVTVQNNRRTLATAMIQACSKQTYPRTQPQDYSLGWTTQQREPQRFKFEASREQSWKTSSALLGGIFCLHSSMQRHQWKPCSILQAGRLTHRQCRWGEHRAASNRAHRPGCLQAEAGLALLNSKSKKNWGGKGKSSILSPVSPTVSMCTEGLRDRSEMMCWPYHQTTTSLSRQT